MYTTYFVFPSLARSVRATEWFAPRHVFARRIRRNGKQIDEFLLEFQA
jgi:hypothetical protein